MAATAGAVFRAEFARHLAVAEMTAARLEGAFARLVTLAAATLVSGGKLIFFGNGGSAADAQHLATELAVRYRANRRPLPAIALGSDGVLLTAAGNDLGFEQVFARQVEALGRAGDVAFAISTSGTSPNIVRGLEAARAQGLRTIALTGRSGGNAGTIAEIHINVPDECTARVQEVHITLIHAICELVEE
jgi:D-sedoheptulose 7-phosphate isomerase